MRRRDFLTLTAAIVWPFDARGQQLTVPVIGSLSSPSAETYAPITPAFLEGLKELGFVEGRNVNIEY